MIYLYFNFNPKYWYLGFKIHEYYDDNSKDYVISLGIIDIGIQI
jgi:hypothetical protein